MAEGFRLFITLAHSLNVPSWYFVQWTVFIFKHSWLFMSLLNADVKHVERWCKQLTATGYVLLLWIGASVLFHSARLRSGLWLDSKRQLLCVWSYSVHLLWCLRWLFRCIIQPIVNVSLWTVALIFSALVLSGCTFFPQQLGGLSRWFDAVWKETPDPRVNTIPDVQ